MTGGGGSGSKWAPFGAPSAAYVADPAAVASLPGRTEKFEKKNQFLTNENLEFL